MTISPDRINRLIRRLCLAVILASTANIGMAQAPIIQPGPPGEPARELSATEAVEIADSSYSPADATFMKDMIPHHHQALEMAALVAERTNRPELIDTAGRINVSQDDEIEFMQKWLGERGEEVPDPTAHEAMHTTHKMAGMATPEQMAELAASDGTAFDQLFLKLMITHHEGAVKMVKELLEQPGSAYDPVLFEFTTEITNSQTAEIERMNVLLVGLSADPRAGLAAGFEDAGQALLNLELVASLPKPPGFFDPGNPAGLPPDRLHVAEEVEQDPGKEDVAGKEDEEEGDDEDKRAPLLSFANTDMAFAADVLVTGSYHGFNIYRLAGGLPELLSSVVCPGGQGDVSIVGDLLIMSVEQTRGRMDCGLQGISEDVSAERFRGIRIFNISDLTRPVQVGAVQTCRGSHTHSVVSGPGEDGKIIVYNSGTSSVREEEEMSGCFDESPGDDRTALFRIDVIEIPVADPSSARIVASPTVFADPEKGVLAGLWRGGDHGDDTQETSQTNHCHDITVFPELGIAGGACSGNGILFDISDPLHPQRIDEVIDEGFAYWHSATFNNDGSKVIFTDEWGGGSRARCRAYDPQTWGADAIYDIVDGKLEFRGYFKMPAPQVEEENCVAHNGSIVPVPGRDIFVQAWYQGGISVIDFTDSANPVEIAYFDRGPVDAEDLILGGFWSTYWYQGWIYGTEIARGLDVLKLVPSEYLSENEIAAAAIAEQGGVFNPQQQFRVDWPAEPVVARAYLDQLQRSDEISEADAAEVTGALDRAETSLQKRSRDAGLAAELESLASALKKEGRDQVATKRLVALSKSLDEISARLVSELLTDLSDRKFDSARDLFLPQFDSKTDVDDIHTVAAVATMLRAPELTGVNYHAVAGAYGIQEGLYVPAPEVFDLAFGARWSDAHQHREQSLEKIVQLVSQTLAGGGHVWVAEAGQSDFTADWLARINGMNLPVDSKTHVHIVQHSDWNESETSPGKLDYVRRHADYNKIADGNEVGNGTPGLRLESDHLWNRVLQSENSGETWRQARWVANKYNGRDGRYNNSAIAAGGMDFSDAAESCWIFGYADIKDADAFFSEFLGSELN